MDYFCGVAAFFQRFFYLFGEHYGAVFSAGATEGDGQVAFAFADVMGNQVDEEAFDATEKLAGLRKGLDVFAHFGIFSGVAAEAGDKVGVGEEAHVEDEVGIGGNAVFVAETDHGDEHRALVGIFEALGDEMAELVDVELGGVDDHIGEFANGLHEVAFVEQAFADG